MILGLPSLLVCWYKKLVASASLGATTILQLNVLFFSGAGHRTSVSFNFEYLFSSSMVQILFLVSVALTCAVGALGAPMQRTRALGVYDGNLEIRDYALVRRGAIPKDTQALVRPRPPGRFQKVEPCPRCGRRKFVSLQAMNAHWYLKADHPGDRVPDDLIPKTIPLPVGVGRKGLRKYAPGVDKKSAAAAKNFVSKHPDAKYLLSPPVAVSHADVAGWRPNKAVNGRTLNGAARLAARHPDAAHLLAMPTIFPQVADSHAQRGPSKGQLDLNRFPYENTGNPAPSAESTQGASKRPHLNFDLNQPSTNLDIDLNKPKTKLDIDLNKPNTKLDIDLNKPNANLDIDLHKQPVF
jgi:hypothetical protein